MDNRRLLALQHRLIKQLPEESRQLARLSRAASLADDASREHHNMLHQIHRLAGRCAQLGFDGLGGCLSRLEHRMERVPNASGHDLAIMANEASDAIDDALLNSTPSLPRPAPGDYVKVTETSGKTALVVEDDPELGPLARGALLDLGFAAVRLVQTSEQALAECYVLKPDLIVCDWKLRKASGLDFLKTLRNGGVAGLEPTPFIMLTGQRDKQSVQTALREGADDFIVKPFAIGRLRQAVARLLRSTAGAEGALEL